jgi:hypothetical protein
MYRLRHTPVKGDNRSMINSKRKDAVYILAAGITLFTGAGLGAYFGVYIGLNPFAGIAIGATAGMLAWGLSTAIKKMIGKFCLWEFRRRTLSGSLREGLKNNMNQARYLKRSGDYANALKTINLIIRIDPDFPEALLLKAQILWEGFENHRAANPLIGQVLMTTSKEEALHQSALWLATDIEDALADSNRKRFPA